MSKADANTGSVLANDLGNRIPTWTKSSKVGWIMLFVSFWHRNVIPSLANRSAHTNASVPIWNGMILKIFTFYNSNLSTHNPWQPFCLLMFVDEDFSESSEVSEKIVACCWNSYFSPIRTLSTMAVSRSCVCCLSIAIQKKKSHTVS